MESFNRSQEGPWCSATPRCRRSSPAVAEHNVTVARAFTKLMGAFVTFWDNDAASKIHLLANPGQDVAPIGAARQGVADAAGQPAVPSQPHEGSLGALPLPLNDTVRNIDIGRGLPAPQPHCRLSHRARAQDAAEWCQHPLGRPCPVHLQGPGRHDDGPVHLVAYQLATLSGTGVSVLD